MKQSAGTADWIGAYLEWTDAGSLTGAREHTGFGGAEAAGADPAEEYTAAYLEWMDAAPPVRERRTQYRARGTRDGDAEVCREALVVALQMESDCIQFLRQIREAGGTTIPSLSFASETIEHAERQLENGRRAWRALAARYPWDAKPMSTAARVEIAMNWPHALEDVAADVR